MKKAGFLTTWLKLCLFKFNMVKSDHIKYLWCQKMKENYGDVNIKLKQLRSLSSVKTQTTFSAQMQRLPRGLKIIISKLDTHLCSEHKVLSATLLSNRL